MAARCAQGSRSARSGVRGHLSNVPSLHAATQLELRGVPAARDQKYDNRAVRSSVVGIVHESLPHMSQLGRYY